MLTAPRPVLDAPVSVRAPRHHAAHRVGFAGLLLVTGILYLWDLSANGWANAFYSAAAQAGSQSWTALLFGSSDAANAITVDKTPGALWIMDASVRLFGLNSWSVLAPQAFEGVAAVALLYAAVRRLNGPTAGLLAGAILALTPVATLMFRFNNPDALLVLLLVGAAYCVQRACEKHSRRWWLPLAGVAVGFAFLAKMAQAFLVVPGFVVAYLLTAHAPLRARVTRSVAAVAAMVVSGGWYVALVALWPSDRRPYIGGSQHNSILELALGYNGFGRLTGDEPGGLGNPNYDAGWGRLFDSGMGSEIAWLIPAAAICLVAALVITWRAPRTDAVRGACIGWGGWLVVTGVVLSYSNGIIHPYYTVALAPAVAAAIGIGASAAVATTRRHPIGDNPFRCRVDHRGAGLRTARAHRNVVAVAACGDRGHGNGYGHFAHRRWPAAHGGSPHGRGCRRRGVPWPDRPRIRWPPRRPRITASSPAQAQRVWDSAVFSTRPIRPGSWWPC